MFRFPTGRPLARLALLLPLLALGSCGGDNTGAIITVPNSVVVADLNNDGYLDVAVAAAEIDETGLTTKPGLLGVELNSPSSPGNFGVGVTYNSSSAPPSGLAVGDLTGTGSKDLVVANNAAGTLSVFMETSPTSGAYPTTPMTISVNGTPNDVQIADINGDGLPDLIVADDTGKVSYLLQSATSPGTFLPPVSLPITNPEITAEGLPTRAISVAVGDLNGDGLPDLAVTSFDVNGDFGQITIYFQDPSHPGTFLTTPTQIAALGEPSQIKIADVNEDGLPDLVVALQGLGADSDSSAAAGTVDLAESLYGAMVVLQNTGSPGTFGAPVIYPSVQGAVSLAIGDLNQDGYPDIAMVSLYPQGQGYVSVMLQDPSAPGTFPIVANYDGSGQPDSVVIGDINHDGLPDLVVADSISAVWYENNPDAVGTFQIESQIGTLD